jgi:6-phosphogluconolactonase
MKFSKFGRTAMAAALSSAIVLSLSSCVRSFTVGYLYTTGTVTANSGQNGIITAFKINNDNGKLTVLDGFPLGSGGSNPVRAVLVDGSTFVYVLNRGTTASGSSNCTQTDPCPNANITEFAVGGNGILTYQNTFFTQGINPFRLVADASGDYLLALDAYAPSGTYCSAVVTNATTCGDVTVFQINQSTGRLTLVTNAQLTSSAGTQVTYFPVPANPIDFVMASGYLMTLSGAASSSTTPSTSTVGQTVYPYTYNSTNGQLTLSQSIPQVITEGDGDPMGQGTAIDYAGGKIYILDNEIYLATSTTPGQILPFTIGTNGALQALVGGAVADDPTEMSPIYLIEDSKSKYIYVANQQGSSINNGAGIVAYVIDPSSSQLSEDPGSPFLIENTGEQAPSGTGASPQCLLEDPSNQYIYTANADSTVTGKVLDPNSGVLTQMQGWTGQASLTGPATWCWVSGRTN